MSKLGLRRLDWQSRLPSVFAANLPGSPYMSTKKSSGSTLRCVFGGAPQTRSPNSLGLLGPIFNHRVSCVAEVGFRCPIKLLMLGKQSSPWPQRRIAPDPPPCV